MAWNSLPDFIQDPTSSTDCFRHLLKKNLFVRYYCIQNIRGFSTIMHYTNPRTHTLDGFFGIGISLIRFRLGLCPGSRWRSLRRFPRAFSQLGRGIRYTPPHSPLLLTSASYDHDSYTCKNINVKSYLVQELYSGKTQTGDQSH